MTEDLKQVSVSDIFIGSNYVVPIYQRNYAWTAKQISQLIDDINSIDASENYFLGNLIVNKIDGNTYEVVDGQQRLTTLYLIKRFLELSFPKESLRFEAREKSNKTLMSVNEHHELPKELLSPEIISGFKIIENYFKGENIDKVDFGKKLHRVFLIRIQVPRKIDLNHYFEVMNTRGEQLELHEIAKGKLLEALSGKEKIRDTQVYSHYQSLNRSKEKSRKTIEVASIIWDKCSDMNSYVQMNFGVNARNKIFAPNWTDLDSKLTNFDSFVDRIDFDTQSTSKQKLKSILVDKKILGSSTNVVSEEEENERFESTISFPNFLLQVNAVIKPKRDSNLPTLDDKNLLKELSWAWDSAENAKEFIFHLLKCRVLFDKYILKREFTQSYKETGKWSLQKLEKYRDNQGDKPRYVATYEDEKNKQLRTLQSCLRITYTSPKTMDWIRDLLSEMLNNKDAEPIDLLENYCRRKVKRSNYKENTGFGIERIVFSYLDYLIYKKIYINKEENVIPKGWNKQYSEREWQFQFRNSIEHFHPQNPKEIDDWNNKDNKDNKDNDTLNKFGNLALITVSGNSKFSNLSPLSKVETYPSIIRQSLKLEMMKWKAKEGDDGWTKAKSDKHEEEMFKLLESDSKLCDS